MTKTLTAIYDDLSSAKEVASNLAKTVDFANDDINIISQSVEGYSAQRIKGVRLNEEVNTLDELTDSLISLGVDTSDAMLYTEAVRQGATLVLLRSQDRYVHQAVQIMREGDPVDLEAKAVEWSEPCWIGDEPTRPDMPSARVAALASLARYERLRALSESAPDSVSDLVFEAHLGPVRAYDAQPNT